MEVSTRDCPSLIHSLTVLCLSIDTSIQQAVWEVIVVFVEGFVEMESTPLVVFRLTI